MSEVCDICQRPVQWPSHYGDWECPHCHQPYEYDEGLRISLTDAQWALLRNPPKWVSVEERLPEDGVKVLVCHIGKDGHNLDVGEMEGDEWCIYNDLFFDVTHWQPLPEPPEVK